jgi:hypothetical protein
LTEQKVIMREGKYLGRHSQAERAEEKEAVRLSALDLRLTAGRRGVNREFNDLGIRLIRGILGIIV